MSWSILIISVFVTSACGNQNAPNTHLIVDNACSPSSLSVSEARLFWLGGCDGSIRTARADGMSAGVLVSDEPNASMLRVDATRVYWWRVPDSGNIGQVVWASKSDGTPVVLADNQNQMYPFLPNQMIVDDQMLYRSEFSDILETPKEMSGTWQVFATGDSGPILAADTDYLYWASSHTVHRKQKSGGPTEQLAQTDQVLYQPIAITSGALFFWSFDGTLNRVDKTSLAVTAILTDTTTTFDAFVSDGTGYLYWQSGGDIVSIADDGSTEPTVVASVSDTISSLAVDDDWLYWSAGDRIFRIARQ